MAEGTGKTPRDSESPDSAWGLNEEDTNLLRRLKEFIRSQGAAYLDDPNITSVGIGYRTEDGEAKVTEDGRPQLAIQFTVRTKATKKGDAAGLEAELEALGTREIPAKIKIPGTDIEIETDVVQRDYRPSYVLVAQPEVSASGRKHRRETLVPGISVGHPTITAGTLGAIVFDGQSGAPCMLSNWHVLHSGLGELGDAVLQPGPHDDDRVDENHAGTLLRSHLGMAGDCAIASIEGRAFGHGILGLEDAAGDDVQISALARPELGDRVVKSGRTTGVTHGIVRRIETMVQINYGNMVGDQIIGCFEIGPDDSQPAPGNEISKGGDSGSVWLIAGEGAEATGTMVGLHFGGEGAANPDEHALACYGHAVFEKLGITITEPVLEDDDESFGSGYNENFLAAPVDLPGFGEAIAGDELELNGSPRLDYTHFTVCLSTSRKLARYVAWNIDGGRIRMHPRRNRFRRDPRISDQSQHGNELYTDNKLDRGHIARRADLVWGAEAEAERANLDSFYWTNIAPQHRLFNQSGLSGLWGELENAIFEETDVVDLRVSVMGGPIFGEDDPLHRGVAIPRAYWKLICHVDGGDGALKASAFVLSQDDLMNDIEALELDEFRIWQVSLGDLESRTHLMFDDLQDADTLTPEAIAIEEATGFVREILSLEDVVP